MTAVCTAASADRLARVGLAFVPALSSEAIDRAREIRAVLHECPFHGQQDHYRMVCGYAKELSATVERLANIITTLRSPAVLDLLTQEDR